MRTYDVLKYIFTLKFLITVLHFLFFFGIFSYLHGLIRTYTFIYFREKFPPTLLLGTTRLFIFEANSQLSTYSIIHFQLKLACKKEDGCNFIVLSVKIHEKAKEKTLGCSFLFPNYLLWSSEYKNRSFIRK